jgi:Holliday junction resolvase
MLGFKNEMKDFKDEMLQFKNEMKDFKDEMKVFKDEMLGFKNEMKDFKDEMKDFKDSMDKEVKRMNKQWGELANKMGTIVEDIVFPATRPVIKKYFKCEPETLMMNVMRKKGNQREEFDVVAVCSDKTFLIEVKSTLKSEHAKQMKEKVERFKRLFPEYGSKKVIPILASLRIGKSTLNRLTKEKIYGMAYREWEFMDILNFNEVNSGSP